MESRINLLPTPRPMTSEQNELVKTLIKIQSDYELPNEHNMKFTIPVSNYIKAVIYLFIISLTYKLFKNKTIV